MRVRPHLISRPDFDRDSDALLTPHTDTPINIQDMKTFFRLVATAVVAAIVPFSTAFAAPAPAPSFSPTIQLQPQITPQLQIPETLSCEVEGSIKKVDSKTNEVTYKIHYTSNYSRLNAKYQVYASISYPTHISIVHQVGGAASIAKGSGYIMQQGSVEQKFTFPIENAPGVTVTAKLDNVNCKAKFFKPVTTTAIIPGIDLTPDLTLELKPNLGVTGTIRLPENNDEQNPPAEVVEAHSCKVLAEGAAKDGDTILIGTAIRFDQLKKGEYPYVVRGYKNDDPNNVKKYEGTYRVDRDAEEGVVFGEDGRAFFFAFDSQNENDGYIISATLGKIDCDSVLFSSPLKQQAPAGGATSSPANDEDEDETNVRIEVVGLAQEDAEQAEELDLLEKTEAAEVQALEEDEEEWTSKDYAIGGLLAAILVALVAYTVLRYRNRI